jgi:hypothetical protein
MEPTQSWVLKPRWAGVEGSAGDQWDGQPDSATASWCHFQLERPRGGGGGGAVLAGRPNDEELAGRALVESGFAIDVAAPGPPPYAYAYGSAHAPPAGDDTRLYAWELAPVAEAVRALLGPDLVPAAPSRALAIEYLQWCVQRAAVPPPAAVRRGYAFCLWLVVKVRPSPSPSPYPPYSYPAD